MSEEGPEPCPFCGSRAALVQSCEDVSDCANDDCAECAIPRSYRVFCDFTRGGCGAASFFQDTREEAIASWNRRVPRKGDLQARTD